MAQQHLDQTGRAYGLAEPRYEEFVLVGPGTSGGELLRRYWQPVAFSADATDLPKRIRRFGEDLILFRSKKGEPGLLYPRCVHRGTSLLYGKVEDDGIRCCYHGWKFDAQGHCLEQPCEPQGGRNRDRVRQPWYPVVEKYGAIWTYMGPPEKQPLFPSYSCFENLAEDEEIIATDFGKPGDVAPYPHEHNWFQTWENATDIFHAYILHMRISGNQHPEVFRSETFPKTCDWKYSEDGQAVLNLVQMGDEFIIAEAVMPNILALPPFLYVGACESLVFFVPWDDTNFAPIVILRKKKEAVFQGDPFTFGGKQWADMTQEEHQRRPHDYEAQNSQGKITFHSEEHLAWTDTGIGMHRRLYKKQIEAVAKGGDPVGVAFREEDRLVNIGATSWLVAPDKVTEPV